MSRKSFIILLAAVTIAVCATIAFMQAASIKMQKAKLTELKEPSITIKKSARVLEVYDGGKLVRTFDMVLGFSPEKDKEVEGDGRTPEGEFYVFTKNPESRFHLSLGLSYPSKDDATRGFAGGLISGEERDSIVKAIDDRAMPPQKTRLGGEIYIHGGGTARDWTDGCIALQNDEMSELFNAIPAGTKVKIVK